jgi:tRNA G18 (ribose-2'-O)-methylase SpoU
VVVWEPAGVEEFGGATFVGDADDVRLDPYRALRARESTDVLWAEGPTVVQRLIASRLTIRSVLLTPSAAERLADDLVVVDAPVFVAPQAIVNEVIGFDLHRGAMAVADRPSLATLDEVMAAPARTLVVLEGVNDPVNLGAIARSVRGLGGDALLLDPTSADPYYRRSVRVSMGEILHLPVARAPLTDALDRLVAAGWQVWALTPRPDATDLRDLVRAGRPAKVALVLGAEGPGLTERVLAAHTNVRIPINPDVDSLNVGHAVTAALALLI